MFIRDIPIELTINAISEGALKKGMVVGLLIHPPEDSCNHTLLEVRISEDEQVGLLEVGMKVPLVGQGSIYHFADCWRHYLDKPRRIKKILSTYGKIDCFAPTPRHI